MRVSFDSNAWEKIFDASDRECAPIRAALAGGCLEGFICEAGFRIEAIPRRHRPSYFAQSYIGFDVHGLVERDGRQYLHMSIGPEDFRHPGLPVQQATKLRSALAAGVQLMRGLSWIGLPVPSEVRDLSIFVSETRKIASEREELQLDVFNLIRDRGVGRAFFDAMGGWSGQSEYGSDNKRFERACAEWADSELVSAHIAYRNDVLCTNDQAQRAGKSVFDAANRSWLAAEYGLVFRTVAQLITEIAK